MATTKSRSTTRRTPRAKTSTPRQSTADKTSIATRTGKVIKDRPVASAAIGTGIIAGIAAAVAGFFAFKKSGKSFPEFRDDVATSVKDKASTATTFVKDGIADARSKAGDLIDRRKDGIEVDKTQTEFSEEALTLKETGKGKTQTPVDPTVAEQSKVGAISY